MDRAASPTPASAAPGSCAADTLPTDTPVADTPAAEPTQGTSADTQISPPQGEICASLQAPEPEQAADIPTTHDPEGEKTPPQTVPPLPQVKQAQPQTNALNAAPTALCSGQAALEQGGGVDARTTEEDLHPPTDWRSGYDILLHLGLIRYLTETPDLTQAGAEAAQAEGLSLTAEDWQSVARSTPPVTTPSSDDSVATVAQTPQAGPPEQAICAAEPTLPEPEPEPVNSPTEPERAEPERAEPEMTGLAAATPVHSGPQQPEQTSDLPVTHWAQAERPAVSPTQNSGLRSLTADRQPGGFPRRSYAGMPRPRVTASVDEDIQVLRRTRAQLRSDGICQGIAQFLSRRHHRTARLRQISSALCGTLINGEEVFDSDITDGINTLVDKGKIVLLSNGDIFLLNPPDI